MKTSKALTIILDVVLGFIVVAYGSLMLPTELSLFWALFNGWLWIVSPICLLYAKRKTEQGENKEKTKK